MIMHFLLATVLFLAIFLGYSAQVSGEYECEEEEEWDACRSPCETTCDDIKQGFRSNCSRPCISGCFCRRGLVRADDRTCVPPTACHYEHMDCRENEEYLDCGSPCALNCTNLNSPIFCTKPCYRGCFCKPNFVRDSKGRCIDPRNCRIAGNVQCPANEEYVSCVNFCNSCSVSENCRTPYCTPGCDCKPGYFRSTYGQCITAEQCVAEEYALQQQCGVNEVYTSCVNPCNDCYSRGRCDDYSSNYCSPGCDCKPGYFRNDEGVCVSEWNCLRQRQPICPPGEEYYDCIPTCKVTCDTYNIADVNCDMTCNRGCFCKRGYIRRADGLCVPPSECPARPLPCPQGETLYQCLPTCRTTCRTLNSSREPCSTECKQGCFCQTGFVRNDNGICVPPSECPFVCGPNQEFRTCGSACPASCENFREKRICSQQRCLRGCFCKTGFVLGPRGTCIRPRDCPILMCGLNEEFRTCGSACPASCENFRERRICSQQRCLRGCFCKTGFVLGPKGICIRPRNCPVRKPNPCCGGLRGRKGNETDDEDTTPAADITTTPVTTETPSNGSSNTPPSVATKPSLTSEKVPDKTTTPKSGAATATPKSGATTATPKSGAATATPKSGAATATPKSGAATATPKSGAATATPKSGAATATPKSGSATTTLESKATTTTVPPTTSAESKTKPTKPATNTAETPAVNVT